MILIKMKSNIKCNLSLDFKIKEEYYKVEYIFVIWNIVGGNVLFRNFIVI